MPITVKVVSEQEYEAWLDAQIEEYAGKPRPKPPGARGWPPRIEMTGPGTWCPAPEQNRDCDDLRHVRQRQQ